MIEAQWVKDFPIMNAEAVRKADVIEVILLSFIEHTLDHSLIDQMEKELKQTVAWQNRTAGYQ